MKTNKLLTVTLLSAHTMLSLDVQAQPLNHDGFIRECEQISHSFQTCHSKGSTVRQKLEILSDFCEAFKEANIDRTGAEQRRRVKLDLINRAHKAKHDVLAEDQPIIEDYEDNCEEEDHASQVDIIRGADSLLEIAQQIMAASKTLLSSPGYVKMCLEAPLANFDPVAAQQELLKRERVKLEAQEVIKDAALTDMAQNNEFLKLQAEHLRLQKILNETKAATGQDEIRIPVVPSDKAQALAVTSTPWSDYAVPAAIVTAVVGVVTALVWMFNPKFRTWVRFGNIKPRTLIPFDQYGESPEEKARTLGAHVETLISLIDQIETFHFRVTQQAIRDHFALVCPEGLNNDQQDALNRVLDYATIRGVN